MFLVVVFLSLLGATLSQSPGFPFCLDPDPVDANTFVDLDYNNLPGYGTSWIFEYDHNGRLDTKILDERIKDIDLSENIRTKMYLTYYNRDNPKGINVTFDDTEMHLSLLSRNYSNVKVVTHGFQSSGQAGCCISVKDGLLQHADDLVIILDWSAIAEDIYYPTVADHVEEVGKHLGLHLVKLRANSSINSWDVHIIGHSLGAHVAASAASKFFYEVGEHIGRVTGLDPAGPSFSGNKGISKDVAGLVDVIHTCADSLGKPEPVGHVDFYPNGGNMCQPGCGTETIGTCSHSRAWVYFAESIVSSKKFKAWKCPSYEAFLNRENCSETAFMGYPVKNGTMGTFYLKTRNQSPFAVDEHLYLFSH